MLGVETVRRASDSCRRDFVSPVADSARERTFWVRSCDRASGTSQNGCLGVVGRVVCSVTAFLVRLPGG
jgi:hypothetical protein